MGENNNNNNNNNNKNNNENNSRTAEGAAWPPPNAPSLPAVPLQRTSCDEASRITSHPPPPSGLHMQTCTYAHHDGIALQCDVYAGPDFPQHLPVFLYFHAGGLVAWDRKHVPPWLVQTCYERRWPLVSASYRLLPQAQGRELRADAKAAFSFATTLNTAFGVNRKIIAGGSSAGFFLAALLAHERLSCLVALVSIYGIPSFQHEFFRSSTMLTPEPIASDAMKRHEEGPMTAWVSEAGEPEVFLVQMLNPDGSRNRDYVPIVEEHSSVGGEGDKELGLRRGLLYEYYVYNNSFPELVHPVDPGFNEPTKENLGWRLCWPPTVVIHGRDDVDFPLGGSLWMRDAILEDKVRVFIAEGKGHLFELGLFLEDGNGGMDVVKRAIEALDEMVQSVV